ncbi:MAG TPA: TerB family tellurite resistance protein [Rhodocyclaceae bacterium]|nr:TerB family tellurite resistance protein [Rhodocyclaceae bacterium]
MLNTLKDLFDTLTNPPAGESPQEREHALQLATAVLLVEIMRSDPDIDDTERDAVIAALRDRFALADDELARLVELAEAAARDAHDYHRFTSCINKGFDAAQRVRIIEYMWQVAYADGHLSAHENHLMRKIADLLYVSHSDYIGAKMRARDRAGSADAAGGT